MTDDIATAKRKAFYASCKAHQVRPVSGWHLKVTLTASDNRCFKYPVVGVLECFEQGYDIGITKAVFRALHDDGTLGAPCVVGHPQFTFGGEP